MPLTDIEKTAIAEGILSLQAGARRGMERGETIGFAQWQEEQRTERTKLRRTPVSGAREQRLEARETRLSKQFEHRQAKDKKAGNRDLFRTSLSLLRALRNEYKFDPIEETNLQIQDTVDEMIRYAKRAGINIRDWIKEEYQEDPTFWDRILRRPGAKKERLIEKPRPIPIKTPTFTTEEEVIAAFENRDISKEEALQILRDKFGAE